jgi:hypothetical protein
LRIRSTILSPASVDERSPFTFSMTKTSPDCRSAKWTDTRDTGCGGDRFQIPRCAHAFLPGPRANRLGMEARRSAPNRAYARTWVAQRWFPHLRPMPRSELHPPCFFRCPLTTHKGIAQPTQQESTPRAENPKVLVRRLLKLSEECP